MPPKHPWTKVPAASSSTSNPIAPPHTSHPPLQSQPAPAGKTKPSGPPPEVSSLQADLVDLREEYDILKSVYEEKRADYRALAASHSALQGKFERLTVQLEQVSTQLIAFQSAAAATAPRPMTKDYASCKVQTDLIPAITVTSPKPSGQQSFAQAVKASAPQPSDKPISALTPVPTSPIAPDSASRVHTPEPFKGRRATKSNELHIQLRSRATSTRVC